MGSKPGSNGAAIAELLMVSRQLLRRLRDEWYDRELSWSQMSTMSRLEREGPATTADLARAEAMKPQSMGTTLAGLEKEGLVERRPHPTDGRQVLFALTGEGLAARRRAEEIKQAWLLRATADLSEAERQVLVEAAAILSRVGRK